MQGFVVTVEMRGKKMKVSVGDPASFRPAANKEADDGEKETVANMRKFIVARLEQLAEAIRKTVDVECDMFEGDHH